MGGSDHTVLAEGLQKRYGDTHALAGLDLAIGRGAVYGLLGPNGAGKTTAVRILATLTRPDSGRANVAGIDVVREPRLVRRRIGLTGQQTAVDEVLSARQNLTMFGRLFRLNKSTARERAAELLAQFGLKDSADRPVKSFSGGMRRRLDVAASMILAPDVLFLDEPTTGLDPVGRGEVWQAIRDLASTGTTVLLTTHYLDEADRLCDRIGVVDHGRNIVEDTPDALKRRIGNDHLEIMATEHADVGRIAELARKVGLDGHEVSTDEESLTVSVLVEDGVPALTEAAAQLRTEEIQVADIGLRRPTLDEAFLQLTGQLRTGNEETTA